MPTPFIALAAILVVVMVFFAAPELRKRVISRGIMTLFKRLKILPRISGTERAALEAGDVWVDRDLFSGRPDLRKLASQPWPHLTDEELAFLDGPVEELCELVDDWQCWRERDLRAEAWDYIKRERFWGMIIPKEYGGLGFSAYAHSEVIMKLTSRSTALAITVMVPNSLGPAELLIHYGTRAQKQYYLPRLARGEEVPCFALGRLVDSIEGRCFQ
jgi:acyl-CoA dehydrogenase